MRMLHADGQTVHLAYCTNVHAAEDLEGIVAQLDRFAVPVRRHLGTDLLGLGLWLAAPAAAALAADPRSVEDLRDALGSRGLEVVTLNGFPYRGFQQPVVKHAVYHPDWTEPARLDYTVRLATILAGLLPDDAARGSISTLPLAWRAPWYADRQQVAIGQLGRLGDELDRLAAATGRTIRVGLEPEPGCVIETTADAVTRLAGLDHPLLGVCLDLCHLAVQFEEQSAALQRLAEAGLPVVKAQVSAALQASTAHEPATREALAAFDEPRFLHQVREATRQGALRSRDDLGQALDGRRPLNGGVGLPWRVHFHVPLGAEPEPPLTSTLPHLRGSLEQLVGGPVALTDHLEVETYTWSVLPEAERPRDDAELARRIAAELGWARDTLVDLGLKEPA